VQRTAAQLPRRQHQLLLDRLSDQPVRLWYAQQSILNGWSRDVLDLQIDRKLYVRRALHVCPYPVLQMNLYADTRARLVAHARKKVLKIPPGWAWSTDLSTAWHRIHALYPA
jgi:predicted nuclease of restriction endonuclease-like (RecB) superfamily